MEDQYKTIAQPSEGNYKEKGSKFLAFAFPVKTEEGIKNRLEYIKNEYHDARHHCYAYRLGADHKAFRSNDDGEPSGTAGKPILGQILSKELTNVLIIVVRYFGGTKLGVSGLINAYRSSSADALNNSNIILKTVNNIYQVRFEYPAMNDVMKILKDDDLPQTNQKFELNCSLNFTVRQSESQRVLDRLKKISSVIVDLIGVE